MVHTMVYSISTLSSDATEIAVEENIQFIELEIIRSFGAFGEIMVALNSMEQSALSTSGRPKSTLLIAMLL